MSPRSYFFAPIQGRGNGEPVTLLGGRIGEEKRPRHCSSASWYVVCGMWYVLCNVWRTRHRRDGHRWNGLEWNGKSLNFDG